MGGKYVYTLPDIRPAIYYGRGQAHAGDMWKYQKMFDGL